MTVKDGFKIGIGVALAFALVGGILGAGAGLWAGLTSPSPAATVYERRVEVLRAPPTDKASWGCGRQCRIVDRVEVCVENPPCP